MRRLKRTDYREFWPAPSTPTAAHIPPGAGRRLLITPEMTGRIIGMDFGEVEGTAVSVMQARMREHVNQQINQHFTDILNAAFFGDVERATVTGCMRQIVHDSVMWEARAVPVCEYTAPVRGRYNTEYNYYTERQQHGRAAASPPTLLAALIRRI